MSVHYLIDGYNLIETHKEYFPGNARGSREQLINLIKTKKPQGSRRNKITVIFDGQPGIAWPADKEVDVRFTSGKEADWHIKRFVEDNSNPKQIIVVTDDRAIKRHVSSAGARTMTTVEFMQKLFPKQKKQYQDNVKNLDPEQIKEINEEFLRKKGFL